MPKYLISESKFIPVSNLTKECEKRGWNIRGAAKSIRTAREKKSNVAHYKKHIIIFE